MSKFDEDDNPVFKEKTITFETLRQNNIYLLDATPNEKKPLLSFGIFQPNGEELTTSFLFSRLEYIFLLWYHHLLVFDISISIYVYDTEQIETVKSRLKTVKQNYKDIANHYATFIDFFDSIQIRSTKKHFKERYQVFRELLSEMEQK